MESVTIRLNSKLATKLKQKSNVNCTSTSQLIRYYIKKGLESKNKFDLDSIGTDDSDIQKREECKREKLLFKLVLEILFINHEILKDKFGEKLLKELKESALRKANELYPEID